MIQGYPWPPSVVQGGLLRLHVSTDAPRFRVDFYLQRAALVAMGSSAWVPGQLVEQQDAATDWAWPAVAIPIPEDWPSGVYVAVLRTADDAAPNVATADGQARALFVVRGAAAGRVLYKIPLFTYHAYNHAGGASFYRDAIRTESGCKLTLKRIGGGTGSDQPGDEVPDAYDTSSERQVFAHWDAPFIRWLAGNGLRVDYCTDLDLHMNPELLAPYRLVLSVGHDEYWTQEMRDQLAAFVERGGNVAFLSANTSWWRIVMTDGGTAMICDRDSPDQWWRRQPENALTGVSYRGAGGWWTGARDALGYTISESRFWMFAGTGLADGDTLGAAARLVGYECDGALLDAAGRPTHEDGTPRGFVVLGAAQLGDRWEERHVERPVATMGCYNRNGTVFTAATTDWARVLIDDPVVQRVTGNVIERLARRTASARSLGHAGGGVANVACACACDDTGRRRLVAVMEDGRVSVLSWGTATAVERAEPLHVGRPACAVACYAASDRALRVVVATDNGDVMWLSPHVAQHEILLRLEAPIAAIAGYAASDGGERIVVAARNEVSEWILGGAGISPEGERLAAFDERIVDIAAIDEAHIVVATASGSVIELIRSGTRRLRNLLATFEQPIRSVDGYALEDRQHVIAATAGGDLRELWWSRSNGDGVLHDALPHAGASARAIAAYRDPGGGQHAIVVARDGDLRELSWKLDASS